MKSSSWYSRKATSRKQAGRTRTRTAGANSVMKLLGDNRPHVFVAGADLDVVSTAGSECAISQGDVLRVASLPAGDAETVSAAVLASKGNKECAANTSVTIALSDLQDMHNHMRESVDDGLGELQKKQGTGGLPAATRRRGGPAGSRPPLPRMHRRRRRTPALKSHSRRRKRTPPNRMWRRRWQAPARHLLPVAR